jgi:hypothetical protein
MILSLTEATQKARAYVDSLAVQGVACSIVESHVREDVDGWYFPYQAKEFLETGDFNKSLVGNWPIFVSRDGRHVGPRRPGTSFVTPIPP